MSYTFNFNTVESKIKNGLKSLLSNVNGDIKKVQTIIDAFVTETPGLFKVIEESIKQDEMSKAAECIHKTKVRYGCFGLNEEMERLNVIENQLSEGISTPSHLETIQQFNDINEKIMTVLKKPDIIEANDQNIKGSSLEGKLVLVAEDDEINAMVFELFIKETGASVLLAGNGNEALKLAIEKRPDFIFMDVHMPFFSGLEAIAEIRKQGLDCPIISLSASTRLNEKQNSLDAGADNFLIKPVNRESINDALMKYLS